MYVSYRVTIILRMYEYPGYTVIMRGNAPWGAMIVQT